MSIRKIKTISDLQQLTQTPFNEDLIEISHSKSNDGLYSSCKYTFEQLKNNISSIAEQTVADRWNIGNVENLNTTVETTKKLAESFKLTTDKTVVFNQKPVVGSIADEENELQTKRDVKNLAQSYSSYMNSNSFINNCNPGNDFGYTSEYQYYWKIENGQNDSSLAYDEDGFEMGGIEITSTGYLTIYGWLASNANVLPQNAWVGLYGLFNDNWTLLQVQPWIMGQYSQQMQYIGFGLPVGKGLILKIKTGFPVNGNNSGFQTYSNTLLLSEHGNVVNSFVGYVIEN